MMELINILSPIVSRCAILVMSCSHSFSAEKSFFTVRLGRNGFDLEVHIDDTHNKAFEILREEIQYCQPIRIGGSLYVGQARDFGTIEANVLVADFDFEFPPPFVGRISPFLIVDRGDFGDLYDPFQFGDDGGTQADLSPDDAVVLVVAVVGVSKFSAGTNLELHKFVTKAP